MYVVDGYNLLHALSHQTGSLPADADRARARMIELLAHIARRESTPIRIYFDGTTPSDISAGDHAHEYVSVRFCGAAAESADREICEYVENSHSPRKLTVVSSDHAVATACRLAGAKNLSSQSMANRLAKNETHEHASTAFEKPTVGYVGGDIEQQMVEELADFDLNEIERRMRGE